MICLNASRGGRTITPGNSQPYQRQRLVNKIHDASTLPDHLQTKALAELESMPDGDRLCHGDFHPGNILLSRPEPIVIDWIDASIGSPLADVARSSILARGLVAIETQAAWT